jgi:hypothetical protein
MLALESSPVLPAQQRPAPPRRLTCSSAFLRPETCLFLTIWLLLLAIAPGKLFNDPGTFWHIQVGRRVLEHGEFLRTDPFSFTRNRQPWIASQWGGELVMAVLHSIAGLDSLLLGGATLLAGLYTWLAHRLMRAGLHWLYAAGVALAAVAVSANHFHLRPHLGTLVLFAVSYSFLVDFEAGRIGRWRLLWLVPLFVVWANVHGGFLGGIGTVALAFSGWALLYLWGKPPVTRAMTLLLLAAIFVLCAAAALVNPFGLELPRTWLYVMYGMDLSSYIVEHARLDPSRPEGAMVLLVGLGYLIALLGTRGRRPRITWLLPLAWLLLSFSRIRHSPLFAIAATLALADLLPFCRWKPADDPSSQSTTTGAFGWRPLVVPAFVVGLALLLQTAGIAAPVIGAGCGRLDPNAWPTDLVPVLAAIEKHSPQGTPIYNEFCDGGFVMYHAPRLRVFNDDRCELYGDRWQIEQIRVVYQQPERIDELARAEGFRLALVRNKTPLAAWLNDAGNWEVIERGRLATLYRRRPVSSVRSRP